MGAFYVNFHFRTTDEVALRAALDQRNISHCYVFGPKNGWTSLCEERASRQEEERITQLAGELSEDLGVPAIAFLVHDSDIACYWLFDKGELLDEYNSCPDYFRGGVTPRGPTGGATDILARYCQPEVRQAQLASILTEKVVFAERVIEQLADALRIDRERVYADYRYLEEGEGGAVKELATTSQFDRPDEPADPRALALMHATAQDDGDEIDRLVTAGAAVDAEAPAPASLGLVTGMGNLLPQGPVKIRMTPLLAAVMHKRAEAAKRLLDRGADPNRPHRDCGSALHVAAGAGNVELLQMLIDHGGDVNTRDSRGPTPLQFILAGRTSYQQMAGAMAEAEAKLKSMGFSLPGVANRLSTLKVPTEGWDACERLLRSRGAID